MRELELLAPAKNLECGIAAIDHGADAVYIGAPKFGARAAAVNTVDDIRRLCRHAHQFQAKVYVTLNTLVYDDEMTEMRHLVEELADAGTDAFLVQDMGLLARCREWLRDAKVELHASTQTDNRDAKKVAWLHSQGFSRVVLARELSLDEMRTIHEEVPQVQLEAFVHGALCVSFSGVCYASQHCFGRSANRGACAQFCRLEFDLEDADGRRVAPPAHWLSLKDMCRLDYLEQMALAGVSSFKIEGRLKEVSYVKNVVAAYSQALDRLVRKQPDTYRRASLGRVTLSFVPDVAKSFNRGFTPYFIDGRRTDIAATASPKAIGAEIGKVTAVRNGAVRATVFAPIANGDGLCFFNRQGRLEGFRVNRADANLIYPQRMPQGLLPGMTLYRNFDQDFERRLAKPTAQRQIPLRLHLSKTEGGLLLSASVIGAPITAQVVGEMEMQPARTPQRQAQQQQLERLGQTAFVAEETVVDDEVAQCFIPAGRLAEWRRNLVDTLLQNMAREDRKHDTPRVIETEDTGKAPTAPPASPLYRQYPYLYNVANVHAVAFYRRQQMDLGKNAFELQSAHPGALLMQCRHCLRYTLGYCVKNGGRRPVWKEPLRLVLPDGRRFPLQFNCNICQMFVYAEK